MTVLHCAHTRLCEDCKILDCKFNITGALLTHAPAMLPVTTHISECQYVNATRKPQGKLQPRAHVVRSTTQGGTMSKQNGKTQETTPANVVTFIVACVEHVKATSEYAGMHVKLSGFNAAFRSHFNVSTQDGIELVNIAVGTAKQKDGKTPLLYMRGAIGGPIIYLWADKPKSTSNGGGLDKSAKAMLTAVTSK